MGKGRDKDRRGGGKEGVCGWGGLKTGLESRVERGWDREGIGGEGEWSEEGGGIERRNRIGIGIEDKDGNRMNRWDMIEWNPLDRMRRRMERWDGIEMVNGERKDRCG